MLLLGFLALPLALILFLCLNALAGRRLPPARPVLLVCDQEDLIEDLWRSLRRLARRWGGWVAVDCGSADATPLILKRLAGRSPDLLAGASDPSDQPLIVVDVRGAMDVAAARQRLRQALAPSSV